MPTSSEPPERKDVSSFLAEHTPFQGSTESELAELAQGASVEQFPAGVVVADYAARVPDEIWMVRDGVVSLRASADGSRIDVVGPGGIFGYMPLLTGAGMDFEARTTAPSTLIRLPGVLVRAQFAKPAGLAFLASTGWNRGSTDRPTIAPATDGRSVAELVHGEVLMVGPSESVRDVVVRMTEHHVSYALIRLTDGGLGIFTDRDLRTRVVAVGLPVDVPIAELMSAPARTVTADLTADSTCRSSPWGDVFAMLQRLRMAHQVEQIAAGHTPGDVITTSELSPLNRSLLGDGLREIAAVRRRVGNVGFHGV